MLVFLNLHFADIFSAIIVVFIKNRTDLLAGFNKLDNLLKVSIFQKYKNPEREEEKLSICL